MARRSLTLSYRRDVGELSTGSFFIACGETTSCIGEFTRLSYWEMLKQLSFHIRENPSVEVFLQRTDRAGIYPTKLSEDEVELFRVDPVTAIKLRTFPPQTVRITEPKSVFVTRPLEAGYTTIAECFGETIYARVSSRSGRMRVECIFCGRWAALDGTTVKCSCGGGTTVVDDKCVIGWAGVAVEELLLSDKLKFFIPRRWNKSGNWISRDSLTSLYNEYVKEKNQCILSE